MFIPNGEPRYNDDQIEIHVHVDPTRAGEVEGFTYHRDLDCIKITAKHSDAHFIQFVTRQYPSLFSVQELGTFEWDAVDRQYMSDYINPKWKLDVTPKSQSCYYDEGGLKKAGDGSLSMYDDPTGAYMQDEERAVFCTFVIQNNQISHLVQWSFQNVAETAESEQVYRSYSVQVTPWDNQPLPLWAVKIISEHYGSQGLTVPDHIATPELVAAAQAATNLTEEAQTHFLAPPNEWVTILKFANRFPAHFPGHRISRNTLQRAEAVAQQLQHTENSPLLPPRTSNEQDTQEQGQNTVGCLASIKKWCTKMFGGEEPPESREQRRDSHDRNNRL